MTLEHKLTTIKWDNKYEAFRIVALKQHMKYF